MEIRIATPADMDSVYAVRYEVFVKEQGVSIAEERDEHDAIARHYLVEMDGICVGCARVLTDEGQAHIGRLAVKKSFRGRGIGAAICRFVVEDCCAAGCERIWLNSQLHAIGFYEKLGFSAEGEVFLDAGIEHRRMEMTVPAAGHCRKGEG